MSTSRDVALFGLIVFYLFAVFAAMAGCAVSSAQYRTAQAELRCLWTEIPQGVVGAPKEVKCWCLVDVKVDSKHPLFYTQRVFVGAPEQYCDGAVQ